MRFRPPLRISVIRREEKEQKLNDFIGQHIAGLQSGSGRAHPFLVVARSPESPVIKAIARLAHDLASVGASVRMIIAQADREILAEEWAPAVEPAALDYEVRWARDPRLIEAHEQLVMGPLACWIGDSMRREPAKCDAFETYMDACAETAASATLSFERLWSASEPVLERMGRIAADQGVGARETSGSASRH